MDAGLQHHSAGKYGYLSLILVLALLSACLQKKAEELTALPESVSITPQKEAEKLIPLRIVEVARNVTINDYFEFMDSLVNQCRIDPASGLGEYMLVHANPWILDTLKNTDYYGLKKKGLFQRDQRKSIVLRRGNRLVIPDTGACNLIRKKLLATTLDVNIPEFTLRIIQNGDTILTTGVRVGRFDVEYLPVVGHDVNLQTPVGPGEIVRVERNPLFVDPDTGIPTVRTRRDDGQYTAMPRVPCLEPAINGIRYGSLIHATTNIRTLGKAYSHGCVGTSEPDAWTIYYNAPLGTKVQFRYNLKAKDENGNPRMLKDIYGRYHKKTNPARRTQVQVPKLPAPNRDRLSPLSCFTTTATGT